MWSIFIDILNDKDAAHSDLAQLAISLINKVYTVDVNVPTCSNIVFMLYGSDVHGNAELAMGSFCVT